jgi:O-antigen ligase
MKSNIQSSYTYLVTTFLFGSEREYLVSNTLLGQIFKKLYLPYLSETLLILSVLLYWYEGYIGKYFNFSGFDWLGVFLVLTALLFVKKEGLILKKTHLWYLIFLFVLALSGLVAISGGINPNIIFRGWLLFAQFGLALFVATSIVKRKNFLDLILVIGVPLSLVGIYQYLTKVDNSYLWAPGENITRVFAFFGSPNVLGILMAILSIVAVGLFIKTKKYIYLAPAALNIVTVYLTFSRSAWIGLVAATIFALIIYNYKLLILTPILLVGLLIPQLRDRLARSLTQSYLADSALDGRLWSLTNSLYLLKKYPLIGSGPGTYGGKIAAGYSSPIYLEGIQNGYTALYYTDNQYLELLVQVGVLGILSFLGFIVAALNNLIKNYYKNKDAVSLLAASAFVCFLVAGLFANVLDFGAIAVPMGILLGIGISENDEPNIK